MHACIRLVMLALINQPLLWCYIYVTYIVRIHYLCVTMLVGPALYYFLGLYVRWSPTVTRTLSTYKISGIRTYATSTFTIRYIRGEH
jgi:hypothetical protein